MKVLVDTNVWLDLILHRPPFEEDSKGCLMACVEESVDLCVAATSLKDIFYITSKCLDTDKAYEAIRLVLEISNAASVDDLVCRKALELEKPDYEDGIIAATATADKVDAIVSRDVDAFSTLSVSRFTPTEFLEHLGYERWNI